jgi:hypothetical protein
MANKPKKIDISEMNPMQLSSIKQQLEGVIILFNIYLNK